MSSYNEWIKNVQQDRNDKANWRCNVSEENDLAAAKNPPQFPFVTLFQNDLVEKYAVQMSSEPTGKNFASFDYDFSILKEIFSLTFRKCEDCGRGDSKTRSFCTLHGGRSRG